MKDDTISRAAALNECLELAEARRNWETEEGQAEIRGIDAVMCALHDLPSAQPSATDTNVGGNLIDRQAAIKTLEKGLPSEPLKSKYTEGITVGFGLAITWIEQLPSAQPERKKGKWIERNPQNSPDCRLIECSECGNAYIVGYNINYDDWIDRRNFCMKCGADLRGSNDKNT